MGDQLNEKSRTFNVEEEPDEEVREVTQTPTIMQHLLEVNEGPGEHAEDVRRLSDFNAALEQINAAYEHLEKLYERDLITSEEAEWTEKMLRATVEEKLGL